MWSIQELKTWIENYVAYHNDGASNYKPSNDSIGTNQTTGKPIYANASMLEQRELSTLHDQIDRIF